MGIYNKYFVYKLVIYIIVVIYRSVYNVHKYNIHENIQTKDLGI